jgi:hypothetical protein
LSRMTTKPRAGNAFDGAPWLLGNPSRMLYRAERRNEAETVAAGCEQLPFEARGKEGVECSSSGQRLKCLQIAHDDYGVPFSPPRGTPQFGDRRQRMIVSSFRQWRYRPPHLRRRSATGRVASKARTSGLPAETSTGLYEVRLRALVLGLVFGREAMSRHRRRPGARRSCGVGENGAFFGNGC